MKQTKKLARRHREYLQKMGISRDVIDSLRFVEDRKDVGYIFMYKGFLVVAEKGSLRAI